VTPVSLAFCKPAQWDPMFSDVLCQRRDRCDLRPRLFVSRQRLWFCNMIVWCRRSRLFRWQAISIARTAEGISRGLFVPERSKRGQISARWISRWRNLSDPEDQFGQFDLISRSRGSRGWWQGDSVFLCLVHGPLVTPIDAIMTAMVVATATTFAKRTPPVLPSILIYI